MSKEERIYQNLQAVIQQYLAGKSYRPATTAELIVTLGVVPQHKALFRKALRELTKKGIIELREKQYRLVSGGRTHVTGTISMHPRGFGFVSADDAITHPEDVFVPKNRTKGAVNGDEVEVRILSDGGASKGPDGEVVAILKRARSHLTGIVTTVMGKNQCFAHVPLLGEQAEALVRIPKGKKLIVGDRVTMEVKTWGNDDEETVEGALTKHLGHISDPSIDVDAAISEYGLRGKFSPQILQEAKKWGTTVSKKEIEKREDLRDWECVTIDPKTAKDFDDAISLTKDDHGRYHLGVHIADVSHYVSPGSKLDNEARLRCNSTYFPGNCIPMLPPELSDKLCSLRPNVNRLTMSVFMTFDGSGNLVSHRLSRTVIRSQKRFSYEDAKEVLDQKRRSKHKGLLLRMTELCALLKKQRATRGSIEFALNDIVLNVDEKGNPTGTETVEYDITHQMIEEFMLKANEVIAKHLSDQGKGVTFRIHEQPDKDSLKSFSSLANAFGFQLPEDPSSFEIQRLFDEALKTPYGQHLAVGYIRSMKLAYYSPNNIGHYGLSLEYYCHFTSPIRRYVDLVAHRALFDQGLDTKELAGVAEACSEQERLSSRAENAVKTLKKLRLLDQKHKDDPYHQYEAVITRVKNFGITFDLLEILLDGFIHISEIGNDYFIFDSNKMTLTGEHMGKCYTVGSTITVSLKEVDLITSESRWELINDAPPKKKRGHQKKTRRKKK